MFKFLKKTPRKEYDVTDDLINKGYINLKSLDKDEKTQILSECKFIHDMSTFHLILDALINIQANIGVTNGETKTTKIVIKTLRNTKEVFRKFCLQQNTLLKPPKKFDRWK